MLPDITTLPNSVDDLKVLIVDLEAQYRARIEFLEVRIRFFQKELFGHKTEKRPPETELKQLHLFNEAEVLGEEEKAQKPLVVLEHTRRRPKRNPIPDDLPRVDVIHDIPEEEKICGCGAELCRIVEEVSEKLDIVPARIQVLRHIRYKYACKQCEGVESTGPTVLIAPPPAELIPMGLATAGLVAFTAIAKYYDGLLLYRQEKTFARYGVDLSRSTMASWVVKAAECCKALMGLLRKKLISDPLVNADETPVQVLDEPGRANTTTSYMWVFCGGEAGREVIFYRYSPTRSGDVPRKVLQGFSGYLQTDAYSAYEGLEGQVRRYFVRVIDARGKSAQKPGSLSLSPLRTLKHSFLGTLSPTSWP